MQRPLRIYFVGAHSTGKTTLARWVRDTYGLPMISEVARGVLAEMEEQLDSMRSRLEVVDRYQAEVFERQITAEAGHVGSFVSDRAFCNLAYAAHHARVLNKLATDPRLAAYMESVKDGLVFFLRPHRELLAEDGVRAGVAWEEVLRIDGMVKLMLELFGIPYIPVDCLPMQERVRLLERVFSLAGLEPDSKDEIVPAPRATIRRVDGPVSASGGIVPGVSGHPRVGNGKAAGNGGSPRPEPVR
ncbi:MAG: AAA family ATPase [Planctomycetota bacterium]|nr:AAA family ATPase [Planctomycetota bacterium]